MMQIAIDGPASSGKSTVAKIVAKKLGFLYVDTGAMYRSITLSLINNDVSLDDKVSLLKILNDTKMTTKIIDQDQHYYINGNDVTDKIREPIVAGKVSEVAKNPEVRSYLTNFQRVLAKEESVVMDGRDIGTVVLPHADFKFFLTASPEVRAKRRYLENKDKGIVTSLQELTENLKKRDLIDTSRKIAPLKKAKDATEIDTSYLDISEVVKKIINKIY